MKLYVLTFGVGMVGGFLALAHDQDGWRGDESPGVTDLAPSRTATKRQARYPLPLDLPADSREDTRSPAAVDTATFGTVVVDPGMPVRIEHALDRRRTLAESLRQPPR